MLKEKTLGNVRFIGELFNVNLITAKIVLECVTGLLDLFESESNQDRLEGACLLLHTGGATFERSKVLQETNRIYDRLTEISNMDISTKNKFKIMDLKEFRESGWKAKRTGTSPTPANTPTAILWKESRPLLCRRLRGPGFAHQAHSATGGHIQPTQYVQQGAFARA